MQYLPKLRVLRMSHCEEDILMQVAEERSGTLEALYLEECEVAGGGLNELLRRCRKLRTLRITPSQVAFDPALFTNLTKLIVEVEHERGVREHPLKEFLHRIAPYCDKLEYLGIAYEAIAESDFLELKQSSFPALRLLDYGNYREYEDGEVPFHQLHAMRPQLCTRPNRWVFDSKYLDPWKGYVGL